jgi:autophagy-related protein 13
MSDYQLSNEDHEALEKFTKFFLVKSAQIIVQSRLGEKKTTKSKPVCSGNEWVNSYSLNKKNNFDCSLLLVSSFN